ncbi:DUF86 domain-containing protein [bacterium]|nr:DUF86 domain-containing protein [bacterium]
MKDDRVYLRHILDAIAHITTFAGEGEATFRQAVKTQAAVIRFLEVIGEAAKNLSPGLRSEHPDVRWQGFAGLRDRLIHQYFGVRLDMVWDTVITDLPPLKEQVSLILDELNHDA